MGFYGSKEWSETVIEIAEKELVNDNRVVFARIQEVRLWVNRLRRFGYPKKAKFLSDKLSSLLRLDGLTFTPSPTTESLASEVPY